MKKAALSLLALSCIVLTAFAFLQKALTGTVTDDNGTAIANASVVIKNKNTGTVTDTAGHFSINAGNDDVLVCTAAGYMPKEMKVGSKTHVNIILEKAAHTEIDEVVVVGYGTQKNHAITGEVKRMPAPKYTADAIRMVSPMPPAGNWRNNGNYEREGYDNIAENAFLKVTDNPLSTFSIDVDAASYSNIRRYINNGQLPPAGAVRIEEMINYFNYNYPQPTDGAPFSINTEYAVCPWNRRHNLVAIGLQGKIIPTENLPASNLVFLIDVSGSMNSEDKLPLVQSSMKMLANQLRPQDKVSIVVYAGNAGLVLPATSGENKMQIKDAIDRLSAGGSTAGGAGIALAYKEAEKNYIKGGNNRVILCTDGDFNVGASSDDALENMIEEKRKSGVYLTVLGYGTGNYQDAKMQKLADKGNGNHAYIDNLSEAKKVLVKQFGGTMFTIAKEVKLQVEFNPANVQGYRLIGYENRMLKKEDFNNDKKDAGEMGSGHTVTALYEIIPAGVPAPELQQVDALKYQQPDKKAAVSYNADEIMTVKFRYKKPGDDRSLLLQETVKGNAKQMSNASANLRLAAAVAQFGMLLRDSDYKGKGGYALVQQLLHNMDADDKEGYKKELIALVNTAAQLKKSGAAHGDEVEED